MYKGIEYAYNGIVVGMCWSECNNIEDLEKLRKHATKYNRTIAREYICNEYGCEIETEAKNV